MSGPPPPLPAGFRRIPARIASPAKRAAWAALPPLRLGTLGNTVTVEPLNPDGSCGPGMKKAFIDGEEKCVSDFGPEKPPPGGAGSTNTAAPGGLYDNPGPDGPCPDGYESVELAPGSGLWACVHKTTGCILGYEPDPKDPSRCRYINAGKPCGPPTATGEVFHYDEDGNCVSPKGEKFDQKSCGRPDGRGCPGGKSIFDPPPPPPPADEGMPGWQKAAIALAVLYALSKVFMPMKASRGR